VAGGAVTFSPLRQDTQIFRKLLKQENFLAIKKHYKIYVLILTKNGMAYILGVFSQTRLVTLAPLRPYQTKNLHVQIVIRAQVNALPKMSSDILLIENDKKN
jgi:hypothetical protein